MPFRIVRLSFDFLVLSVDSHLNIAEGPSERENAIPKVIQILLSRSMS